MFSNPRSLAVGERVIAITNHTLSHKRINMLLCNDSSCSRVVVYGTAGNDSGSLVYLTFSGCNELGGGNNCRVVSLVSVRD